MSTTYECALFRNERDTTISKIREALTKEGDIFLGQKIIEVRRIGPPHDVWYKLGGSWVVVQGWHSCGHCAC